MEDESDFRVSKSFQARDDQRIPPFTNEGLIG
jgi:hypothetical protein